MATAPARRRLGRHRRDHQLHEHVQPVADDRGRAAGEEGGRARPETKPWVKTSLAPGLAGRDRLPGAGGADCATSTSSVQPRRLRLHDLHRQQRPAAGARSPTRSRSATWSVAAVLSGNRNFEGRIHPQVRANYLASPPLVVAYALAGTRRHRPRPASRSATDRDGQPVFLRDIWPTPRGGQRARSRTRVQPSMFREQYGRDVRRRRALARRCRCPRASCSTGTRTRPTSASRRSSRTARAARPRGHRRRARAGAARRLGDDRPHLARRRIPPDSPAGRYLIEHGVEPRDFNCYGSRRGNHEVMVRGTFANIRLRNQLVAGREGGVTQHLPDGRADDDLRRGDALPGGGRAAGGDRRQGVRLGQLARLGGEGHAAAGRPGRDRRELRAHPPQQPGRHGRAAAAVRARRVGRDRWA